MEYVWSLKMNEKSKFTLEQAESIRDLLLEILKVEKEMEESWVGRLWKVVGKVVKVK